MSKFLASHKHARLAIGLALVVALMTSLTPANAAPQRATVGLSATTQGTVLAQLAGFPSSARVNIVATTVNGSGQSTVNTSSTGAYATQIRVPANYTGAVQVTATSGAVSAKGSLQLGTATRVASQPWAGRANATPVAAGNAVRTATPTANQACLTGGSGGAASDEENLEFTDSSGQSSKYHVFAEGVSTNQPVGLMLYMHGDGAAEMENSGWVLDDVAPHAKAANMVMVPMLTPDSGGDTTWWEKGDENAVWVQELVQQQIYKQFNIDRSRVWLVGYSGGSQFITKFLVPEYSELFCGGGAIVFGGGGASEGGGGNFDANFKSNFVMHWYTGAQDNGSEYDALSDAKAGSAAYEEMGFKVTAEHPSGIDHDNIPFGDVVGELLPKGR